MSSAPVLAPDDILDQLRAAVQAADADQARALARRLLDDDAAELFENLDSTQLTELAQMLGTETVADLLSQLTEQAAADVLEQLPIEHAADVLEEIDPDDAADIIVELDPGVSEDILVAMEPADLAEIRELMAYRPDTAGGIMTPEFVAMAPSIRADRAVAALRRVAEEAETINYVYVTNPDDTLEGVLSLHRLVLSRPDTPVSDLMYRDPIRVHVDDDQEEVARTLTERHLLAIPVVDDGNRLVGIITADDVADVIEDETTEDIELLGGSLALNEPYLTASPFLLFRKRIVWLLVLFMAQFVTLEVYDHYRGVLETQIVLAMFVPILIGTGGNVGSQTVTTIIRAMAVGEAAPRHFFRIIGKELMTAIGLGLTMGFLMFLRGTITDGAQFGLTVGLTVGALIMWAATVGAILPLALSKLKVDPAVVSAPFISSFVDATGLVIYFTLASYILHIST